MTLPLSLCIFDVDDFTEDRFDEVFQLTWDHVPYTVHQYPKLVVTVAQDVHGISHVRPSIGSQVFGVPSAFGLPSRVDSLSASLFFE